MNKKYIKNYVLYTLLLIFVISCSGIQNPNSYEISGKIKNFSNRFIYILDFYGFESNKIDSVKTDSKGAFSLIFNEERPTGLYRFVFANKHHNFIFNNEDIEIKTNFYFLTDSMKIIKSEENKILNDFIQFNIKNGQKTNTLFTQIESLQQGSNEYKKIREKINTLRFNAPHDYIIKLHKDNPGKYVARLLKSGLIPLIDYNAPMAETRQFLIDHMLDNVDFSDTTLINSQVFAEKAQQYFSLYESQDFEETEQGLIRALNKLMSRAAVNDKVFNYFLEYISEKYEKSDFDNFFAYLTENYLIGSSCKNEEEEEKLKKRLDFHKMLAIGKTAPDFQITLEDSSKLTLSEMKADYKLLLFWASWCGHCKELLPEIKNIYNENKSRGFEILAVSLDSIKYNWKEVIKMENFDWINYSELKAWDGSVIEKYGIWATPAFFLLDKNNKIILKPRTPDQLRRKLKILLKI